MVDEGSQVVLASAVSDQAGDVGELLGMIEAIDEHLDLSGISARPRVVLADAGYCSEDNLEKADEGELDVLDATGRLRRDEHGPDSPRGPIPKSATRRERMARRLRTKKGWADYARRKAIVEPAFGHMKVRQRAGFLRLRGLDEATSDWTAHGVLAPA